MAFWKIHVSQILYTNLTDFSKERTGKYSEIIYHSKHLSTVSLINENDQLVTNHLTLTCLLLRGGIAFAQPKSSNKAFHKERLQSITISGTNLSPQLTWKFDLLQKDIRRRCVVLVPFSDSSCGPIQDDWNLDSGLKSRGREPDSTF